MISTSCSGTHVHYRVRRYRGRVSSSSSSCVYVHVGYGYRLFRRRRVTSASRPSRRDFGSRLNSPGPRCVSKTSARLMTGSAARCLPARYHKGRKIHKRRGSVINSTPTWANTLEAIVLVCASDGSCKVVFSYPIPSLSSAYTSTTPLYMPRALPLPTNKYATCWQYPPLVNATSYIAPAPASTAEAMPARRPALPAPPLVPTTKLQPA